MWLCDGNPFLGPIENEASWVYVSTEAIDPENQVLAMDDGSYSHCDRYLYSECVKELPLDKAPLH